VPKKIESALADKVMLEAGLKPLEPYRGAGVKWKCEHIICGAIVFPRYDKIVQGQSGCKSCAYKSNAISRKIGDVTATEVMISAGLKPMEPYKGAGAPWKCECLICGNQSTPTLHSVKKGTGCKYCSGNAKLDAKEASDVMFKADLQPLESYVNSSKPWKSKCLKCGKTVSPTLSAIKQGQGSCRYCARVKVDEEDALKNMILANLQPLESYEKNGKPWKSKCLKCGKIVSPTYSAIQQGQGGCVYCSGKKVDPEDAEALMLEAQLQPLEPYKSHDTKWKCKCLNCEKIVFPRYDSIKTGQGGCIYCAGRGINMNVPSYLYLITNESLHSHKVGIGNYKKANDRLSKFNQHGWLTYRVWNFKTGGEAWKVETSVFRVIRKELGLPVYLSKIEMPATEGHTETISSDSITLLELERIIRKAMRDASKVTE